ncbi:hypothetical protein [Aestuariivivens sediminis]|uniref:hypothetical protein n=1 Tax=Aestuariivivens sediminis TaxID=2913557 RepID=UPI001F58A437|nr:hypothetical protein [Aestuariivivens sediminis]
MKTLPFILSIPFFCMLEVISAQHAPNKTFANQDVFSTGFPKTLSFRNDKLGVRDDYKYWEKAHINFNSITKKYLKEEVDMPPVIAEWANIYATKHPEKLMLVHLNGEGRSVNDPNMHKLYFPGHWIYEEGTFPLTDIDKNQNTITVERAQLFSEKAYTVHGRDRGIDKLPHDIILVELDDKGNRLWDTCEFATVKKVDYQTNSITLKRGMYHTTKRNFKKGNTYIAPIAGDFWGGNLMWYYNLSTACPLDDNGHSAADVFVNEMKNWFSDKGILNHLDGIGFDVNYFESKHGTWDTNNDGKADRGFVNGKNIWRAGDIDFLKSIRAAFGDDFIITADGWRDDMQRAVGILNGMETEGLCRYNDGYRQISRTINQHLYWNRNNTTKYQFSYITSKLRHPDDAKISTQLHRMGMALSSCLGVTYAYSAPLFIPEAVGGTLNQINWLGNPLGEMHYTFAQTPDLLQGSGLHFNKEWLAQFNFKKAHYQVKDHALHITGKSEDAYENLVIPGPEIELAEGDLVVVFEAKAMEGLKDLDQGSLIPRKINVKLEGLPEFPAEPMNTHRLYNDLAGFMGTAKFTPQMFYFRNAGGSGNKLRIILEAQEQGEFAIRNLKVYNAPCGIYRAFENGVVLVNPSLGPLEFDLKSISGHDTPYRRLKAAPPTEGILDGPLHEVMEYNNGEVIKTNEVTVPGLNALFLIRP